MVLVHSRELPGVRTVRTRTLSVGIEKAPWKGLTGRDRGRDRGGVRGDQGYSELTLSVSSVVCAAFPDPGSWSWSQIVVPPRS